MTNQSGAQVHRNRVGAAATYSGVVDIADIGVASLAIKACHAFPNEDIATAVYVIRTGSMADCSVVVTNRVGKERLVSNCVVARAVGIVVERLKTGGRVFDAVEISEERTSPGRRIIEG